MHPHSLTGAKFVNLGTGFTIGFGLWTIWNAAKQTMAHRCPSRSIYIYMIWGEILSDLCIALIAWLFFDEDIPPGVPVYFFITFFWVFEIQLLMQIIINRVAVVVNDESTIRKIKWGTAAILTTINVAVFVIWIPAQLEPPPIPIFVKINRYWDRTSKVIILFIDAALNWYFLVSVRKHLLKEHGLLKYKPLVRFNARLMVVSILMDAMLIVVESLPGHGIIFEAYHPVAYMVKVNIEMTMAALIVKIAQGSPDNMDGIWYHTSFDRNPPEYNQNSGGYLTMSGASSQGLRSISLPDWPLVSGSTYTSATGGDNTSTKMGATIQGNGGIKTNRNSDTDISVGGGSETREERPRCGIGGNFSFGQQQSGNAARRSNDSSGASNSRVNEFSEEDSMAGGIVRTREVEIRIEEMVMGKLVTVGRGREGNHE